MKYGKIDALLTNNTTAFSSPKWRDALEREGIKCYHSSKYHACANMSESILRDVGIYLRVYCYHRQKAWYSYCSIIEHILNRTPNPFTKISPEKFMTGQEPSSLFYGLPNTIDIPDQTEVDEKEKAFERVKKRAQRRKDGRNVHDERGTFMLETWSWSGITN